MAFASNLLGAVVGGAVEYVALITGYAWLLVVVAALYVAAWVLATRFRILADRDLAPGSAEGTPGVPSRHDGSPRLRPGSEVA